MPTPHCLGTASTSTVRGHAAARDSVPSRSSARGRATHAAPFGSVRSTRGHATRAAPARSARGHAALTGSSRCSTRFVPSARSARAGSTPSARASTPVPFTLV
ncbi:hypothetical protein GUJ93_ZPchr0110g22257 [Zizania palustris]|uniref:Uncharacterized protein n=1 Tax=Zizania palustris TaxID=103762 RepID=A0A8J5RC51_ZIZPA|nr:hypothetical protein GUJ93_ZPchr0110g22257 [Zizania palustris]